MTWTKSSSSTNSNFVTIICLQQTLKFSTFSLNTHFLIDISAMSCTLNHADRKINYERNFAYRQVTAMYITEIKHNIPNSVKRASGETFCNWETKVEETAATAGDLVRGSQSNSHDVRIRRSTGKESMKIIIKNKVHLVITECLTNNQFLTIRLLYCEMNPIYEQINILNIPMKIIFLYCKFGQINSQ